MFLYILSVVMFIMLIINYYLSNRDVCNPAVIFCIMNLLSIIVCIVVRNMYNIVFHFNTFCVLGFGVLIFTISNLLYRGNIILKFKSTNTRGGSYAQQIIINNMWIILFILFELIVAYANVSYIKRVAIAYSGTSGLIAQIGVYNYLVKFNEDALNKLAIGSSRIYAYGFPLCVAFSFFLIAVIVNNYFVKKKVELIKVAPVILLMAMSLISGSRSFAFTIVTAVLCDIFIIRRRVTGKYSHVTIKLFVKIVLLAIVLVIGLTAVVGLLGRAQQGGIKTFFTYLGASFFNLDSFLLESIHHSEMWGRETFGYFYNYIGTAFHVDELIYNLTLPFRYANGVSVGNVYTMYYQFILDFGYIGVLPLTVIIAFYYFHNYHILIKKQGSIVSMRLIIFSMLFNDLIMLVFSNRFFESALRTRTIRFYFWLLIIWVCYKKGLFSLTIRIKKLK